MDSVQRVHDLLTLRGWNVEPGDSDHRIGAYSHPDLNLSTISIQRGERGAHWQHYHAGSGELVSGNGYRRLAQYLNVVHSTGGDVTKLKTAEELINERRPVTTAQSIHRAFVRGSKRKRPKTFTRYSEDTFVKANVNPALDIPRHHELLTKYNFRYVDAMPMTMEKGNKDFIHSYVHEKDIQGQVCSDGAWLFHFPHAQEANEPPGAGTWLNLETELRRQFGKVTESLNPGGGFGAIYQYYYAKPQYGQVEDPEVVQSMPPRTPSPVEQTIDSVLAGLSTRDAINDLVHRPEMEFRNTIGHLGHPKEI